MLACHQTLTFWESSVVLSTGRWWEEWSYPPFFPSEAEHPPFFPASQGRPPGRLIEGQLLLSRDEDEVMGLRVVQRDQRGMWLSSPSYNHCS